MAKDDDQTSKLLSKPAMPKIAVPTAQKHEMPKFRLPSALKTPVRGVEITQADSEEPRKRQTSTEDIRATATATPKAKAKAKKEATTSKTEETKKAETKQSKSAEKSDSDSDSGEARSSKATGKKRAITSTRKDPTGRFGDRTQQWFGTGDEISEGDEPAHGEYAAKPGRLPVTPILVALAAALIVAGFLFLR